MESKFSENVKALRRKQGITQEQLSEAMGVTVETPPENGSAVCV